MTILSPVHPPQPLISRKTLSLGLILTLFALRYMVTGYRLAYAEPPTWVLPAFEISTYFLVAVFLVLESQSLRDYNSPPLALWIIILFKPMETIYLAAWSELNSPLALPKPLSFIFWVIALGLFIFFRSQLFKKGAIRWYDLKWALIGLGVGLATALLLAYPSSFEGPIFDPRYKFEILRDAPRSLANIPYQFGYAAVSEEPVFRGFLWGYLRKIGWRDVWIWIFQAALFMLGHLYYLKSMPISFWLVVPVGGLTLGWLAWRSRSIATSTMAHGVVNGLSRTLAILVMMYRS